MDPRHCQESLCDQIGTPICECDCDVCTNGRQSIGAVLTDAYLAISESHQDFGDIGDIFTEVVEVLAATQRVEIGRLTLHVEITRLTLQVDELTAQRDAFGQKAHQLQEQLTAQRGSGQKFEERLRQLAMVLVDTGRVVEEKLEALRNALDALGEAQ
jgi:hypothetical protein